MEVTVANIEKDNTEESNADEIIKYQSLPIPNFSCTQWREYREKLERKERKNKKKSRAKTAVASSSRSKSHGSIKSVMKGSLSTFLSKKLVSKARDVVLVPKNILKKGFINSDKPSIEDKLRDMYLTDAIEEKNKVKDNKMEKDVKVNFICNYLEKLVIAENLSYLYLKKYTDKFLVSIRKPNMDVSREKCIEYLKGEEAYQEFLNAVDNGEIPEDVFLNFENHCDILLYNIHAILNIEKFITVADGVENLFYSTFVHLKPNSSVIYAVLSEIEEDIKRKNTLEENESNLHFDMSALLEEFKDDITQQTIEGSLNKMDIESKFYFEMSGPLHLKIDEPSTLDLMDFFLWKKTLLEHNTLSLQDGQPCCGTEIHFDPSVEVEFNQEWLQRTFEHISSSSQEADLDEFLYLDESPSFTMRNNKRNFMYLLSRRRISKGHSIASNSRWNMQLVEIFFFNSKREVIKDTSEHRYEEVDVHYKLPVFTANGLFYTYWSEETENKENIKRIKDFLPHDIVNITCIGSREKLDKYIYNFVEMISERFRRYLMIEYNYGFEVNEKKMVTSGKCVYYTIEKYVIGDFCSMENDFVEDLNIESEFVLSSGSCDSVVEVVDEVPKEINTGDWQGCPCFSCSGDATDDIDAATATDDIDATTATDDIDAATATDDIDAATATDDIDATTVTDDVDATTATDDIVVATATDNLIGDATATDDFISAATSDDDFVGTSTCGFIGTSTCDFIDASTSTSDFIDSSTSAGDFIVASTSDDFMDIAAADATSTDITATDDIAADFYATSTDITATDDIAADFYATSTDITTTDDIAAAGATSTDITITDDIAAAISTDITTTDDIAAVGATSTDITTTDDIAAAGDTSTDITITDDITAAGATSTDITATDNITAAAATTSTDAAAATTSTDDDAVTATGDITDDDDDDGGGGGGGGGNVAAVVASALNIHPDHDPDYDVDEDMPYFEIEFPYEEDDECISSSPEGDMAVEENSLVLSSEQSMLSQVDEDMPLNDQNDDKAMLSDEEFIQPVSGRETMLLSENILHDDDVEDVPHSQRIFSLIESDLYGNQMNWENPENYPAEFDPLPVLSGQPTQVSDTSPCSLDDSQLVSKDKYNPSIEAISDEDEPESAIPSREAASNEDILSEVFKQTNVIYTESYIQPAEFDPLPVLSGQPTQVSDISPCSLGDSQPVSKDKYNPFTEAISDDEPDSTIPSTPAASNKDILSEGFKQTNIIYPESFLSQGGYTPHYGIEDFPDLTYTNQVPGMISENFQYGHPFYGLHNEHASFGEEPVEHNVASGIQDLSFKDSLYGSQLNQKISENTCNIKTVSSAELAPGIDPSAEPAPGVDPSTEPAPVVDPSTEPAPGVDPSAEPTPGVDPSADDDSNKSLDEVNLYDHETSGEILEKNPNLEFAGFREDPLNDDEIMPHEVPVESAPKSSGPFIYVSSTVKSGLVKTVFEAHEFELDNTPRIQLTKNDSKEEKVEAYPCLHKEFFL